MKTLVTLILGIVLGFVSSVWAQAVTTPTDLTTGLFLYLPLDGSTQDLSGRGNHGTATGGLTYTKDRFGVASRACLFNGVDASISIPSSETMHPVDQLTIAFWIRVDSMTNNHMVILHKGGPMLSGWSNREYAIYKKANYDVPYFLVYSAGDSSGQHEVDTWGEVMHEWMFFTAVYDRKNHFMAAYVNGTLIQQVFDSYSSFNRNDYPLTIGTEAELWSSEHSPFKGALDDIRFYKRALTGEEIAALYGTPSFNLTLTTGDHQINLSWPALSQPVPMRYRIYRGEGAANYALYDSVEGSTSNYADVGLLNGTRYFYKVAALDESLAEIAVTNEASGVPHGTSPAHNTLLASGGPIYAGMSLLGDSTLYVVATGDAIYKMNTGGIVDYTLQVGGSVRSSSAISRDSVIYVSSTDRNVYAFSAFGAPLWPALPLGGELSGTPAIDEAANMIYLGVENKNFFGVDRATGKVGWTLKTDAPIRSSAILTSGRMLVFSTVVGTIYALDLNSVVGGVPVVHTLAAGDSILASPAVDLQGALYVATLHGGVMKLHVAPETGVTSAWQVTIGTGARASAVIDGAGTLYIASLNGAIYAVDTGNGGVQWSYRASGSFESTPAISGTGTVYCANDAGELIALSSAGQEQWYYRDTTSIVAPLLYDRGTVYCGTVAGKVMAFHDGSSMTGTPSWNAPPAWGTFQGNNRRTGNQQDVPAMSVSGGRVGMPVEFSMAQNFPNPFNPTTVISCQWSAVSDVRLVVYDLLGREVAVLMNGTKAPGRYEVEFDGTGLSSGVYFYRLTAVPGGRPAGQFVECRKMVLMK